jgi:polyisoprenoid-binding protein YceI
MSRTPFALAVALFLVPIAASTATAQDQSKEAWQIDPNQTVALFSVHNLGVSAVRGSFTKVHGSILLDEANPANDQIQTTIETHSLNTGVLQRDNELRSSNFFDVSHYAAITFKSKEVEAVAPGKLKVTGDLTIHGVTKEVVLDIDGPTPAVKDRSGNARRGASASVKIVRQDFGVNGAGVIGDEITITLDAEIFKAPAQDHPSRPLSGQ